MIMMVTEPRIEVKLKWTGTGNEIYRIEPRHSSIEFLYEHIGFGSPRNIS